jgi:ubiquinone biosynthesis protein
MGRNPDKASAEFVGRVSVLARAGALLVLRPWAAWATRAAIVGRSRSRTEPAAGRFTGREVRRLMNSAWERFDSMALDLPAEPTLGSRQNVVLACLTLAMFQTLLDDGIARDYAVELVGDACWKIYAQWGHIPRILPRILTREPSERMRMSVNAFLRFPFNRPGYRYEDVPEPRGRALDMVRCPVADYLRANGASDLALGSWCNLDFQLARMWGGSLERTGSMAGGAERCDFRFLATPRREVAIARPAKTPN